MSHFHLLIVKLKPHQHLIVLPIEWCIEKMRQNLKFTGSKFTDCI